MSQEAYSGGGFILCALVIAWVTNDPSTDTEATQAFMMAGFLGVSAVVYTGNFGICTGTIVAWASVGALVG